jgi:putative cell wall-binding protein
MAGVIAWLLLLGPVASAAGDNPPDQVDPPAEGEGEPLEDPSDPPPPEYSASSYPSASVDLSGTTWPRPNVTAARASQQYTGAVRASRMGWPDGARRVVIAAGDAPFSALAASTLAGTVNGPLLLTDADHVRKGVARELRRLHPGKVFAVGALDTRVLRQIRSLGYRVEHLGGARRLATAAAVAQRAVELGANPRTVIVASADSWKHNLGVPALAAGRRLPVLLAHRGRGADRLHRQVNGLGARRVLVIGGTNVIRRHVVQSLPSVDRIAGDTPGKTAIRTARRGHGTGLDRRPVLVGGDRWTDATTAGVMAAHHGGVALVSRGRELSQTVANYLTDIRPGRITVLRADASLPRIALCQVTRGAMRSWFCAEQTLKRQGYVLHDVDGYTDRFSVWAVYAFEKVAGLGANGHFAEREWRAMLRNPRLPVRRPDLPKTHVEINIGKQLILLIKDGKVRNHIHTSTGKPSTPTIRGTFTVYEKRNYRQSNGMYRSIFFHGGYAMHGYPSIPLYPASHGCARTYDGNEDFIYPRVFIGERVATY